MLTFTGKPYIYLDYEILQEESMDVLLPYFAERHKQIRLFVNDAWELEEAKRLAAYEYICDAVYGADMGIAVLSYAEKHKQKQSEILMITTKQLDLPPQTKLSILQVGECSPWRDLTAFLNAKGNHDRRLRRMLIFCMLLCVGVIVAEFMMVDQLPAILQEGVLAFLFFLIPIGILFLCFAFGCQKGVFRFSAIFELLDLI